MITDGSCIIWKLPDLKPIHRLIIPGVIDIDIFIIDVAIYHDYNEHGYIGVWKSSYDNFEHQPQFNLQHLLKGEMIFKSICIDDYIICSAGYNVVTTWDIETGQEIQKIRFDHEIICMRVKDQKLSVSEYNKITVRNFRTNELISKLSDEQVYNFCISDNNNITLRFGI